MRDDYKRKELMNEITNFVISSSDTDNLILSAFIAGIQVGRNQESNIK